MKYHHIKLTGALLLSALFITADASAQRRGVGGGGAGPSMGGSAGMGMIRPQPSIAPPQNYSPPRGGDNTSQGFGGPRRGGNSVAPPNQQGNARQPNAYPGMVRRGTDENNARGSGAFGRPSTR